MATVDGFLNLNKPAGWTSHDCVAKVRRLLKTKRVGHGGTLDPAATGVLPIAVGRATRLLQYLPGDKAYQARIRFGIQTATDDLDGEILDAAPCPTLSRELVTNLLPHFQGQIQQIPPKYSAIQVGGKRLYELARSGAEVDVPVRTVDIYAIEELGWYPGEFPELEVAIACGSGTYIRAIARDLGDMADTKATLAHLVRTRSSGFDLAQSITLEQLAAAAQPSAFLLAPQSALQHLPQVTLSSEQETDWLHGKAVEIPGDRVILPTAHILQTQGLNSSINPDTPSPSSLSLFLAVCSTNKTFLGIGCCQYELQASDRQPVNVPTPSALAPDPVTVSPKVVFN